VLGTLDTPESYDPAKGQVTGGDEDNRLLKRAYRSPPNYANDPQYQPRHYQRSEPQYQPEPQPDTEAQSGVIARNGRAMKKLLQRQFFGRTDNGPGISRVMIEAFNIVQDRISRSRLAGDPPDIIIQPRLPAFGLFDFHRAEALIECGITATKREIEDIKIEIGRAAASAPRWCAAA
jgi:predicted acylesterase/phospholipase RssA